MRRLGLLLVAVLFAHPASSQPRNDESFIARRACPATRSIVGGDPVAPATLEVGRAYGFVGANKEPPTHYQIVVPGADPERRWVDRTCGDRVAPVASPGSMDRPPARGDTSRSNILAISWQPAFCEGQSNRPECRDQGANRPDASRFSLHGLWPQPRGREYCGDAAALKDKRRSADWTGLPAPELSSATRAKLDVAMPGARSGLDRHEWARHGSCFGTDAEAYYSRSLALLGAINASAVAELFAGRIGQEVSAADIRGAFDRAFGPGAGERVRISCRDDGRRRLVNELTIGLSGEIGDTPDLGALMRAARPTRGGCPGGIVDASGLQ